jgi:hypothetical protein
MNQLNALSNRVEYYGSFQRIIITRWEAGNAHNSGI